MNLAVQNAELMRVLDEWLLEGRRISLPVNGSSMRPLIPQTGAAVEMIRPDPCGPATIKRGDILLVRVSEERFALHRVTATDSEGVWINGDAQCFVEGQFPWSAVHGKALGVVIQGRLHSLERGFYARAGLLWLSLFPVRCVLVRGKRFLSGLLPCGRGTGVRTGGPT